MENRETISLNSSQPTSGWTPRLMPEAFECLREPSPPHLQSLSQSADQKGDTAEVFFSTDIEEADRERLYQCELLDMFRERLRFNAFLGLVLIPLFQLFYFSLSPEIANQTLLPHGMMATVCVFYLLLSSHIRHLVWARLLTAFGYTLLCLSASLIMVTLSQNQFGTMALTGVQLAMLAAHSQILLSVVLLPLTLWESLLMTAIVTISLGWSSWWSMPLENGSVHTSQLFVLITTAVFVLCVVHFQAMLRRRAFDASFDLALSAAQLQTLSTLDAVTGGYNRFYLQRTLALEISRATRFSHPLSALMFDLDNFKVVNDTQGHTTGDEVLRAINQATVQAVRDVDTVTRYGGDEFMVVLPETERDGALEIAHRVQQCVQDQLQQRFGAQTPCGSVTLSVGVVTLFPDETTSPQQVIALADERLYEAKRMGKDRIAA